MSSLETNLSAPSTDAADKKAQSFKAKAESQTSKIITEIEKMRKLSNRKYYTYTDAQVTEMFNAIQSSLDELKSSFSTGTPEHKKLFQFSK